MAAQFVVYQDNKTFRWYLRADNGDVIVRHEHAYASREEAEAAIQSVIDNIPNATVVDDGDKPDDEEAVRKRAEAEAHAVAESRQRRLKELKARKPKIRFITKDGETTTRL